MGGTSKVPIDKFVKINNMDKKRQSRAIKRTAQAYRNSLDKKPLFNIEELVGKSLKGRRQKYSPTSLPSICNRFGRLFAKLQSYPYVSIDAEKASIRINKDEKIADDIIGAINTAVMAGMLLKNEDEETLTVGLHPFYSPLFNISFRYPFYSTLLVNTEDFVSLLKGTDIQAQKATDRILNACLTGLNSTNKSTNKSEGFVQTDFLIDIESVT